MARTTVSVSTKVAYGIGQIAEAIKSSSFELFLFFYYNQVLGLSGTLAGLAVFIALCVDAVTDPLIGSVSDNWRSRWGRRHPLMYISAIPLAIAFAGLFAPPGTLGQVGLFVWLTVFAILVRFAMTLYHVPHLALGAELSDDYEERTAIVGYRTASSLLGSVMLVAIGFGVFFKATPEFPNGQLNAQAYPPFARFFGVLMWVSIWWSALGTHRQIPHLLQRSGHVESLRPGRMLEELRAIYGNASFRVLFVGILIFFVMRGVQVSLGLHAATFFWELSPSEIEKVTLAIFIGFLAGVPFASPLSRVLDKKWIFLWAIVWALTFHTAMIGLRLLDLLPANGEPALVTLLVLASVIGGMGAVQAMVAGGSMIADIADEHELLTGRRQEGMFVSGLTFATKAASGLGHAIAGIGIDLIHFPVEAQPGEVAAEVIWHLGFVYGPGVGILGVIALVVFSRYTLTRERLRVMQAELNARRRADVA